MSLRMKRSVTASSSAAWATVRNGERVGGGYGHGVLLRVAMVARMGGRVAWGG